MTLVLLIDEFQFCLMQRVVAYVLCCTCRYDAVAMVDSRDSGRMRYRAHDYFRRLSVHVSSKLRRWRHLLRA